MVISMKTYFAALCSYAIVISLGILFRFICVDCIWLILLFAVISPSLHGVYREASCHSLEIKDFAIALIMTLLDYVFIKIVFHPFDFHQLAYTYLCAVIGIVQYASSIRFKTLIDR